MATQELELTGGDGRPIAAELLTSTGQPTHGFVLMPGIGYTCQMPAFHYIEAMALSAGAAVLPIAAVYRHDDQFRDWPVADEARALLAADVQSVVRALLDRHDVRDLTIVAKSLTTIGLAGMDWTEFTPDRTVRLVWLTPLLRDPVVIETLTTTSVPSLVSIGTADHAYDATAIERLAGRYNVTLDVIEGADHGYGHGPDIDRALATIGQVVRSVRRFAFPE